jgi:hypothetical protein
LAKANEKQRQVVKLRKAKNQAVRNAQKFAGQIKQRYQKLKKEERRLEVAAKKAVAAARRVAAQAGNSAGSPSGDLVWPVPGYPMSDRVGPRIHPIYGYDSCHTGIDIASPTGTSVKAADSEAIPGQPIGHVPVPASAFHLSDDEGSEEHVYGRYSNPVWTRLEAALAQLEEATTALCFGSGMAAVTAALRVLSARDSPADTHRCRGMRYLVCTRLPNRQQLSTHPATGGQH